MVKDFCFLGYEEPKEDGKRYLIKRRSEYFQMQRKAISKLSTLKSILHSSSDSNFLGVRHYFTGDCFHLAHLQTKSRKKTLNADGIINQNSLRQFSNKEEAKKELGIRAKQSRNDVTEPNILSKIYSISNIQAFQLNIMAPQGIRQALFPGVFDYFLNTLNSQLIVNLILLLVVVSIVYVYLYLL